MTGAGAAQSWYVDWAAPDGRVGGFVRLVRWTDGPCWCWLYVVDDDATVVVRDHDVPAMRASALLARSDALWCEMVCEVAGEHWAVNAEAFGVRLDDPADAIGAVGEVGERIAVGLELDWEASGAALTGERDGTRWEHQRGTVRGDILLGRDTIDFAGTGDWEHATGVDAWLVHGGGATGSSAPPSAMVYVPLGERRWLRRDLVATGGAFAWREQLGGEPVGGLP